MADIALNSNTDTQLNAILMADSITSGSSPSYDLCKKLYEYHPLGQKMVDKPVKIAQSQRRGIVIQDSPGDVVQKEFDKVWRSMGCDQIIANVARLARIYGISALAVGEQDKDTDKPLDYDQIDWNKIYFQAFDPLNVAGSLVLNQDVNAPDFQKPGAISAGGKAYHPSRSVVTMNEAPIYISYTDSAFGFSGRSVYQRALPSLKNYISLIEAEGMVARKAGLLISKQNTNSSIIDGMMQKVSAVKRSLLKEGQTNQVLQIGKDDSIETLNMMNADGVLKTVRAAIIETIAAACDMPARMLNNESFAQGFGEGSEDTKDLIRYIEEIRAWLDPLYRFFDKLVQKRAWTEEFYQTVKAQYPDQFKGMSYQVAYNKWANSFDWHWPSLMQEPESEKIKVDDIKLKGMLAVFQALAPIADPANKALLATWLQDNVNEMDRLYPNKMTLDAEALAAYEPPSPFGMGSAPQGMGAL